MAYTNVYDPKKVQIIVNGVYLTGFRDGNIYNYERVDDAFTVYKGSLGEIDYSKDPANMCNVTIGLKHTSPSNSYLEGLLQSETHISLTVIDGNNIGKQTISGENGIIIKRPDSNRAKEVSEREWVFSFPNHKFLETSS